MKKVWVLMEHWHYDSGRVLCVFDLKKKALVHVDKIIENNKPKEIVDNKSTKTISWQYSSFTIELKEWRVK